MRRHSSSVSGITDRRDIRTSGKDAKCLLGFDGCKSNHRLQFFLPAHLDCVYLILNTTSAHSYNFIFPNVGVGVYTVDIQLGIDANANVSGSGTAVGAAAYGLGSLTVESVRLVNGFSF